MQTRRIGKSGIDTAVLAMGAWAIGGGTWWGENNDEVSIRSIHQSLEYGINWVDTAPVYGFGHSEDVVGKALQGRRDKVILSTKCGLQWYDTGGSRHFSKDGHDVYRDLSPKAIRRDLEYSLKRLNTDYIDVYYTHWQSVEPGFTSIEETMNELMKMKQEGKIRAIGASNVSLDHLREYIKYGQLDAIQEKFSILDRKVEKELLPFCEDNNITLQTYSPIEQGLLTGKFKSDYQPKPGETRENKKWWHPENIALVNEMLLKWADLTQKYNCTLVNLIINWTIQRSDSFNVLCGARKLEQVEENVRSMNFTLESADIQRITRDADEIIVKSRNIE